MPSLLTTDDMPPPESPDALYTLSDKLLNSINFLPTPIEVKGSHLWKEKDMTKIQDLKTLEKTFDWSFSTPYKGTVNKLSKVSKSINNKQVQIDMILKPEEL